MQPLVDFLNHGALPFIGREEERERIVAFWRSTIEAQWMRAAMLIGEAGVGKSRLIEEAIASIAEAGGLVIHAKLYPESATALAPLVARELGHSEAARRLLKNEPEPTLPAVVVALRRLSRLRPTLLVLEDIHLLSGDSLVAFSSLLNALADEILSVLCAARPVEVEARGVVERYLVEEIELAGLSEESLDELLRELFQGTPGRDLLEPLGQATRGNPLAVRSALRSALTSDMLARDEATGAWTLNVSGGAFGRSLNRNIGFLVEGMATHLSREEKEAAERLASLGEVFARETAQAMIDDAPRLLDQLLFKGVIVTSRRSMPPLHGPASEFPTLAFTHTLLHEHLARSGSPEIGGLIEAIAGDRPLYSILPFQTITRHLDAVDSSADALQRTIQRGIDISADLDEGPDWSLAMEVWSAAASLAGPSLPQWSREERLDLEARLLVRKLGLYRRRDQSDEYETLVDALLALTEGLDDPQLVKHRIFALLYLHWREFRRDYPRCQEIWRRVDELIAAHPELRLEPAYATYLGDAAHAAAAMADPTMLRMIERRMEDVLALEMLGEKDRANLQQRIFPKLLPLFDTEEELTTRRRMLTELATSPARTRTDFKVWKITFLESIGEIDEALKMCDDLMHQASQLALPQYVFQCSLVRLCGRGAFGADLDEVLAEARLLCSGAREEDRPRWRQHCDIYLSMVGLLRGDATWARTIHDEFAESDDDLWPEKRLLLATRREDLAKALEMIPEEDEIGGMLRRVTRSAIGEEGSVHGATAALELLTRPILRLDDLLLFHAVLLLADMIAAKGEEDALRDDIREGIRGAVVRILEWLAPRSLASYMAPILERYGRYLPKKEEERWRGELAAIARDRRRQGRGAPGERIAISMLGTVAVERPGEEPQRIRGARLRTMLGLLVANRMLDKPLGHREFCRLASGGELDLDLARRNTNQAALRLRESLGAEAIVTGPETHELNLDLVRVDLLDADRLLREAIAAERERALIRAVPALRGALEITRGEVPFPGLYDDFFEALRSDFEHRLRSAVIGVARELLREGDPASGETLLRGAFEAMPEDEEISELLCQALAALGERTEAERIRMRAREMVDG